MLRALALSLTVSSTFGFIAPQSIHNRHYVRRASVCALAEDAEVDIAIVDTEAECAAAVTEVPKLESVAVNPSDESSPEDNADAISLDHAPAVAQLKERMMQLAASTNRGQLANVQELDEARTLAEELERLCCLDSPASACAGTWSLTFSDTQLFRSSPFFMAGRAVCADGAEAKRYDTFCDLHRAALAISEIGQVRQIVSYDQPARLTSEFEVRVGAVPFASDLLPFLRYSGGLPVTIKGAIVSSASIEAVSDDGLTLLMDTVEIKGSNIPLLRQVLDAGLRLESRRLGGVLEESLPGYSNPRPLFATTYVDATMRISRDQDGKLFVYSRESDSTEPTDYSSSSSDLGLASLLDSLGQLI